MGDVIQFPTERTRPTEEPLDLDALTDQYDLPRGSCCSGFKKVERSSTTRTRPTGVRDGKEKQHTAWALLAWQGLADVLLGGQRKAPRPGVNRQD